MIFEIVLIAVGFVVGLEIGVSLGIRRSNAAIEMLQKQFDKIISKKKGD